MADLSSLASFTTTATSLSNLILVSPQKVIGYQPQNSPNADGTPSTTQPPPSFLFDFEGEQSIQLDSDITDHFIEDNTALQDQITIKPPVIITHGFIGELNNISPSLLAPLKFVSDKLTTISAYTPSLSASALISYNNAFQLYQVAQNTINSSVAAWSSVTGSGGESVVTGTSVNPIALQPNQNRQQKAFQQFFGYWNNRTLFTVQTPWAIFKNMAIKSMRSIQDAETKVITNFEMSFKQIRIASTSTTGGTIGTNQQGRSAIQSALQSNLGTSTPISGPSLSSSLSSSFGVS